MDTYRTIKKLDLDVIHTHTEFSVGMLGKHMARSLGIPCIHTYHTMYEDYTHYVFKLKYGKSIIRKAIIKSSKSYVKKYDGIIAPTDKTLDALRRYGVTNRIYVIPTGIDLRAFKHYDRDTPIIRKVLKENNLSAKDKIILSLGRLSEEKNVQTIIGQMPSLLEREPDVKLLIVGDGPYRTKLEKLCRRLSVQERVVFVGKVPFEDVSLYYSLADVFVSASKSETQGLTIMEAMASMVPVIVFDDLNVKDVVIKDVSGRLFKTEEELTDQLHDCFTRISLTKDMTLNGASIIRSLSKESFARSAENVYSLLLQGNSNDKENRLNA